MDEFEGMLLRAMRQNTQTAVQQNSIDEILKFTKLFLELNLKDEAYSSLSEYLNSLVARHGHEAYQKLSNVLESRTGSGTTFIDHISDLFRFTALTIEEHSKVEFCLLGRGSVL